MSHPSNIAICNGPHDPHAFDHIPVQMRRGDLDIICPLCAGRGQWNVEIDLISQRSKRHGCDKCDGRGWLETGDDPVPSPDIVRGIDGHPHWTVRMEPSDDRE